MTTGNQEQKGEDLINVNDTVILTNLPVGQLVRLRDGATAEVTANPRGGGWVRVRFAESPANPALTGAEDMAFATDVVGVLDIPGLQRPAASEPAPVGLVQP